ncbi:MAG TPA: pyridoxamine 5'-phosphate oxidase family protein [Chloroflexia bacterium]|nr:pyridoxamine 5'-phosphate oxidase family protein [Chloroflexia bacterium]
MSEPPASRPYMPEYGIAAAPDGQGLLPWSWAAARLEAGHNYWVATVRPEGRPHVMAVWGVWLADAFYFSTGARSRKAQNLAENAACVVCTENADEAVIVEGQATILAPGPSRDRVGEVYQAKYQTGWPPDSPVYVVRPDRVFGFIEHDGAFTGTATRWSFPDPAP